ncbi:MAG TPA: hypothetical protein VKE93_18215 [Candidatus Angelobacter sp.]|nr:hypothetical protein [Candidatus Angelobacter sp.]
MDSLANASAPGLADTSKVHLYVALAVAAGANLIVAWVFGIQWADPGESLSLQLRLPAWAFLEYGICYVVVAWDLLAAIRSGFLITTGFILAYASAGPATLFLIWQTGRYGNHRYGWPFPLLLLFSAVANVVLLLNSFIHASRIRYWTTLFGVAIGVVAAIALPCMLFALWKRPA